ncbi:CBS domain-containing protein [Chelatococcus sp. SYSU_G07232]|uniref:CBS domain-containing protein n=1 Tax=Chelatococcus albus TaxID=3047466 RepID=A0ABT7AJ37_9HYPH|nr:CBS domain-containing protein [Chelatococcus sp. SYSU_G07232]MDJ1159389.1 CBS domain-containing protein [Chelatococcus sp. SYSU_G07232]
MTVAHILATKGRDVVTIQPHRTLAEAARLLAERRIGAVVVAGADRTVLGILSERDIVRMLAAHGASVLDDPVSRHMTSKVMMCSPSSDINEVMGMMTEGRFRHLPVIEDGKLAGIVSIGDVVKHRLAEIEAEHRAMREYITMA